MRKMTALFVSVVFAFGMVGYATAQSSSAPAPAPAEKKEDKKMDKMEKKPTKKADRLGDCMTKAGTDDAKKADCEKKYAKKPAAKKNGMAEKKPEEKK